ncbi:MAG: glutamate racemase [Acidobacteriota bacterium]
MNRKAIGVFDSGIGGLTVYKAIKELMPGEKVIYLGDTAHLPYGTKSPDTIIKFSEANSRFLTGKGVKIIVIACNSSSSYAIAHLQDLLDIPVLGVIDPGSEAAVDHGEKEIGVIGTSATISSGAYKRSILDKEQDAKIISRDCPLFVPLVEEGWIDHKVTDMVIEEYLLPLKKKGIKTLVLGCTHYPVLKNAINRVLGSGITLIDSAEVMAVRVQSILKKLGWLCGTAEGNGDDEFYVTDFPERFKKVGEIFLKRKIDKVKMITL